MPNLNHGSVQANPDGRLAIVQAAVVSTGRDYIFHAVAGNRSGDQGAHQKARDGCVAIGEVKDVRFLFFRFVQVQAAKARIAERFVVVAISKQARAETASIPTPNKSCG